MSSADESTGPDQPDLAELVEWRDGAGPWAVWLIHSATGTDRARLVSEVLADFRAHGWQTVVVSCAQTRWLGADGSDAGVGPPGADPPDAPGTVLVVEEAGWWPDGELGDLLDPQRLPTTGRILALFMDRSGGLWWHVTALALRQRGFTAGTTSLPALTCPPGDDAVRKALTALADQEPIRRFTVLAHAFDTWPDRFRPALTALFRDSWSDTWDIPSVRLIELLAVCVLGRLADEEFPDSTTAADRADLLRLLNTRSTGTHWGFVRSLCAGRFLVVAGRALEAGEADRAGQAAVDAAICVAGHFDVQTSHNIEGRLIAASDILARVGRPDDALQATRALIASYRQPGRWDASIEKLKRRRTPPQPEDIARKSTELLHERWAWLADWRRFREAAEVKTAWEEYYRDVLAAASG